MYTDSVSYLKNKSKIWFALLLIIKGLLTISVLSPIFAHYKLIILYHDFLFGYADLE